jgi:hypothetical protein
MYQWLHDFIWGAPDVQLAIAWFVPLIASAIGGLGSAAAGALTKNPQVDQSQFKLGAGLEGGSVNAPFFNFEEALDKAQNAPGAANPYLQDDRQFRDQQLGLASLLGQTASGQGQSLAEAIVNQQFQKQQAQLMGAIASQPGRPNVGMSQRLAAQGSQALGANAIESAKTGRLAEIDAARALLGNVLTQGRGGDVAAGGLAVQSDVARQSAIDSILARALQREQAAAELAAAGEKARIGAEGDAVDRTRKLIGAPFAAAGSSFATLTSPTAPTARTATVTRGGQDGADSDKWAEYMRK